MNWPESKKKAYHFKNIPLGGGGFITGIIFSPIRKGLSYLRTDIGGAYCRFSPEENWRPILDWLSPEDFNLHGVESIACDPIEENRVYLAVGTYQNPGAGNGEILRSDDCGKNWVRIPMPFKMGANEAGRNSGERLSIDPNNNAHLLFGTRQNGLWKSLDYGNHWFQVASFPVSFENNACSNQEEAIGKFAYEYQALGITQTLFHTKSGTYSFAGKNGEYNLTQEIFALVSRHKNGVMHSIDAGQKWEALRGQPEGLRPIAMDLSEDGILYLAYSKDSGPNSMAPGALWSYHLSSGLWNNITPELTPQKDQEIYFLDSSGNTSLKKQDEIRNSQVSGQVSAYGIACVHVNPRDPANILCSSWGRGPHEEVFITYDRGQSWQALLHNSQWDNNSFTFVEKLKPHWISKAKFDPFFDYHISFTTGYGLWSSQGKQKKWFFDVNGIEETVPLSLLSLDVKNQNFSLLSGVGDIDGFFHKGLTKEDLVPLHFPVYKNTEYLACAGLNHEIVVRSGCTYHNDKIHAAYSLDGGINWKQFYTDPLNRTDKKEFNHTGPICINANGNCVVWCPEGDKPRRTLDWGASWDECQGTNGYMQVIADKVNPGLFYAWDTKEGSFFVSSDQGKNFYKIKKQLKLESHGWGPARGQFQALEGREGELLLCHAKRLIYSNNRGNDWTTLSDAEIHLFTTGRADQDQSFPMIFIHGKVNDVSNLFYSKNHGERWVLMASQNQNFPTIRNIYGDMKIPYRIYVTTNGRGLFWGEPGIE